MLPNFIVIGAPKCGTTSICDLLSKNPDIFISSPKEPRFFSHDEIYSNGIEWYKSLFESAINKKAIGEGSTSYSTSTRDKQSAERIYNTIPHSRIIYCVRNPIKRIESIWMQHHLTNSTHGVGFNEGKVSRDFNADVLANPMFLDTSCYWSRIETFREKFTDDNIFIVFLEDLKNNPHRVLSDCFKFLGVNPDVRIADADRPRHVTKNRSRPTPLGSFMLRFPGANILKRFFPHSIKTSLRFIEQPFNNRPQWNSKTFNFVVDYLNEDISLFLSYCGKQKDFWDMDI